MVSHSFDYIKWRSTPHCRQISEHLIGKLNCSITITPHTHERSVQPKTNIVGVLNNCVFLTIVSFSDDGTGTKIIVSPGVTLQCHGSDVAVPQQGRVVQCRNEIATGFISDPAEQWNWKTVQWELQCFQSIIYFSLLQISQCGSREFCRYQCCNCFTVCKFWNIPRNIF